MTKFYVRAPRAEVRIVERNENGQGFSERRELAEHSASQIGFDGKVVEADDQGRFEVTKEEHDRLVAEAGFESAGTDEDAAGKSKPKAKKSAAAETEA